MSKIQRAILSVTDKTGLVDFARKLSALGIELISTGGTAKLLRDSGITVKDISELTGFPEMLDGRVKTLHPKVHGGILHRREDPKHIAAIAEHGIAPIDMVVVNLYAFEKTAAKPGVKFDELIENIDIGGPSMIRSAAKNFRDVAIVTSPSDYDSIADELSRSAGTLSRETKWRLAQKAFATTAAYDSAIASTLERISADQLQLKRRSSRIPADAALHLPQKARLAVRRKPAPEGRHVLRRLGHRRGQCPPTSRQGTLLQQHRRPASRLGSRARIRRARDYACAIIKHTNPCGAATGKTLAEAYKRALECDPVSAFGGVIGVNRPIDAEAAEEMHKLFLEVIAAPGFDEAAKAKFAAKKNLRLVEVTDPRSPGRILPAATETASRNWVLKNISGGMLVQDADVRPLQDVDLKVVTKRAPTPEETRALLFAWKVCKHVKSNAIVYARDGQTVGVGAGQMSRVDSAKIGAMKAQLPLQGTVAASDAFFPFPDGVEEIAKAGATAIIQPGGSQRDPEVIAAADRLGLAMLFTGVRHFRH